MSDPANTDRGVPSARSDTEALAGPAKSRADRVATLASRDSGVPVDYLGDHLISVIDAARAARRLSRHEIAFCRRQGEDAAERGIALAALLDLYLSAAWRLWADIESRAPMSSPAAVASVAATLFRASDDAAEALASGYARAQMHIVRLEESRRREFFDDLLVGTVGVEQLYERATRFGFNVAASHRVAVVRTSRNLVDAGPIHRRIEAHVLERLGGQDVLVATKDGQLVCILPGDDERLVGDLMEELHHSDERPWQIGVGRSMAGPGGVVHSFGDARHALELAAGTSNQTMIARFEDLLPQRVLTSNPGLAAELVESVLGALRRARGGAEPLIATIEAHVATSGNVSATARTLGITARAVVFRLDRIAELTGHSLQDPNGRFFLELAVRSRRLLPRPQTS